MTRYVIGLFIGGLIVRMSAGLDATSVGNFVLSCVLAILGFLGIKAVEWICSKGEV